ncbi:hypothetical protein CF319_g3164 [Tilletia indica]|uniref:Uncharacterized protein n=1 Tax=Tilletia walkeri TaxID=117179 RepID=A0A8X7N2K6_9BASI|nr:hypothetical protein CF327_g6984 [Tilletia walkeri]KAE8223868.1 hypothetical protein CF319_g3164 [Tilletia indica]KAE8228180.1 hypothetical protein CF326_g6900 [Tilletia indica]KAE8265701.1 hypothetical protein A4X09_0g6559 [Tilletia walkeri]
MRSSLALFSKALRLALTSKRANKDFYKGTRTGNIMRRKRIALTDRNGKQLHDAEGRVRHWNLKTEQLDESRIPCFVVPPGLAETQLKPYVFMGDAKDGGVSRPRPGFPGGPKMSPDGFTSSFYQRLVARTEELRRRDSPPSSDSGKSS